MTERFPYVIEKQKGREKRRESVFFVIVIWPLMVRPTSTNRDATAASVKADKANNARTSEQSAERQRDFYYNNLQFARMQGAHAEGTFRALLFLSSSSFSAPFAVRPPRLPGMHFIARAGLCELTASGYPEEQRRLMENAP